MRHFFLIIASIITIAIAHTASAQSYNDGAVTDKIERLERDLQTLQRQVYRGDVPSGVSSLSSAPQNEANLTLLEEQISRLTGRIEELEYQNKTLVKTIDKLVDQSNYQQLKQSTASDTPVNNTQQPEAEKTNDAHTFLQNNMETLKTSTNEDADPIKQQYDNAFNLLRQAKFSEAEAELQTFIAAHEDHDLTSNAYYWLGETYYVQKDYEQAAVNFLRGYKKFPEGTKASDSLLKLAMSLGNLGKKVEACTSLNKLAEEFPHTTNTITQRAEELSEDYSCQS